MYQPIPLCRKWPFLHRNYYTSYAKMATFGSGPLLSSFLNTNIFQLTQKQPMPPGGQFFTDPFLSAEGGHFCILITIYDMQKWPLLAQVFLARFSVPLLCHEKSAHASIPMVQTYNPDNLLL